MAGIRHNKVKHPKELIDSKETFNTRAAKKVAAVLGDMKFFWFCVVLDLAMLPTVITNFNVVLFVTYIAQTVVQLLALPVLQVYQNLISVQGEAKAEVDHEALTYIAQIQDEQVKILNEQTEILKELKKT